MNKNLIYTAVISLLVLAGVWSQWKDRPSSTVYTSTAATSAPSTSLIPHDTNSVPPNSERPTKLIDEQKNNYMEEKVVHHFSGGTEFAKQQTINETPIPEEDIKNKERIRQNHAKVDIELRIKNLVDTKEGGEDWQTQLTHLQEGWKDIAKDMGLPISFAEVNCYKGGCATKITFDQQTDIRQFTMKVLSTKTGDQWDGDTYLSGPIEVQAGIFESTWIFTPAIKMRSPDGV